MFCASKTPGFKNRAETDTSKSDPRALVVWVTTVARTRSLGPVPGMLKIKHGRIFAIMPRSTSHTSPRRGFAIASFSCIEVEEQLLGDSDESIVANVACFTFDNLP